MLKPQDILLLLKIQAIYHRIDTIGTLDPSVAIDKDVCHGYPQRQLAKELGLSVGEVNNAKRRLIASGLVCSDGDVPYNHDVYEFSIHGLKYVFPAKLGTITRGMPTSYAAKPLEEYFHEDANNGIVPVWPDPEGFVRGHAFEPIYKSAPFAAKQDKELYQYLVLLDAIRGGRARERKIATEILKRWLLNEEYDYHGE